MGPRKVLAQSLRPVLEDLLQQSLMAIMLRLLEHHQKAKYFIFRVGGEEPNQGCFSIAFWSPGFTKTRRQAAYWRPAVALVFDRFNKTKTDKTKT